MDQLPLYNAPVKVAPAERAVKTRKAHKPPPPNFSIKYKYFSPPFQNGFFLARSPRQHPTPLQKCGVIYEEFQHFAGHIQYKKCEDALRDETPGSTFVPAEHRGKKNINENKENIPPKLHREDATLSQEADDAEEEDTEPDESEEEGSDGADIEYVRRIPCSLQPSFEPQPFSRPPRTVSYRCSFGSQPQERPKTSATAPGWCTTPP